MQYVCPVCKKQVNEDEPAIPFCSSRCKLIDLGAWLNEDYKVIGCNNDNDNDNDNEKHEDNKNKDEVDEK